MTKHDLHAWMLDIGELINKSIVSEDRQRDMCAAFEVAWLCTEALPEDHLAGMVLAIQAADDALLNTRYVITPDKKLLMLDQ